MFEILEKRSLNPTVTLMRISAPKVAKKAEPGQFIILRTDADGERIPLTIADRYGHRQGLYQRDKHHPRLSRILSLGAQGREVPRASRKTYPACSQALQTGREDKLYIRYQYPLNGRQLRLKGKQALINNEETQYTSFGGKGQHIRSK